MGRTGHWVRWVRKPSVCKAGKVELEELCTDESIMEALPVVKEVKASGVDECIIAAGSALHTHGISDMDIDDLNAFPALSSHRTQAAARIFRGAWATKPERELTPEEPIPEITPENVPQTVVMEEPS